MFSLLVFPIKVMPSPTTLELQLQTGCHPLHHPINLSANSVDPFRIYFKYEQCSTFLYHQLCLGLHNLWPGGHLQCKCSITSLFKILQWIPAVRTKFQISFPLPQPHKPPYILKTYHPQTHLLVPCFCFIQVS